MNKKDAIRAKKLGMGVSHAGYRLRRMITFMLLERLGETNCYRCGKPMTQEDYSIEHKTPWEHAEDPKGTFFDLSDIAFSHKGCNSKATMFKKVVEAGRV